MKTVMSLIGSAIELAVGGAAFILKECFSLIAAIFGARKIAQPQYDAHFAESTEEVSRWNQGFSVSGTQFLTKAASTRSMLVAAPSGAGKSQTVIFPTLFNCIKHGHALVVHDCNGELFRGTAPTMHQNGYSISCINFTSPSISDGYNPLLRATNSSEINKLATKIIQASMGNQSKDPFWQLAATNVLVVFIKLLSYYPLPHRHLANVRQLLILSSSDAKAIDKLVVFAKDEQLLAEYKSSIVALSDATRNSVLATCKAALQPFADEHLATTTSCDTLNFANLRTRHALFIQNPSLDAAYYQPIISILFEQMFSHILESPLPTGSAHCFFIIDELTSLNLPSLGRFLEVGRKRSTGCLLAVQDLQQLKNMYKTESDTIMANCSSQLFISPPDPICEMLEKRLGSTEFETEDHKLKIRPLLTRQQLRALDANKGILFQPNSHPMLLNLTPAYRTYGNLMDQPPLPRARKIPYDTVPLITKSYIEGLSRERNA